MIIAIISFLHSWIVAATMLPPKRFFPLQALLTALINSQVFALYVAIITCLGYSIRRYIPAIIVLIAIPVLSVISMLIINWGVDSLRPLADLSSGRTAQTLSNPGLLIKTDSGELVLVGTEGDKNQYVYTDTMRSEDGNAKKLTILPDIPQAIHGILNDAVSKSRLQRILWQSDPRDFILHIAALTFMLASLRFIFSLTAWPLANTLLGILLLRWVLVLDIFIHGEDFIRYMHSIMGGLIPEGFISPATSIVLGLILCLYTVLNYVVTGRAKNNG